MRYLCLIGIFLLFGGMIGGMVFFLFGRFNRIRFLRG